MNNKNVLLAVAAVIVIVGAFFLFRNKGGQEPQIISDASTSGSSETPAPATMEQSSIQGLLAGNQVRKCTFESAEQGMTSQGTVYVADGKFRGDFTTQVSGKTEGSHMISDGEYTYIWTEGIDAGFKMKIDPSATPGTAPGQSMDPNKPMDFKCEGWAPDWSLFIVPSYIKFSEAPTFMMPKAQ